MYFRAVFYGVIFMCGLSFGSPAWGVLQVVTTTEDLASIAREIGGDEVNVVSLAKGYQDPHFIEAKPSHLMKLKNADVFIQIGLELEVGWAPPLLSNSRNGRILPGQPGFLDASEGSEILDRPEGRVDRSGGDVHPMGNPHYWTDPENGRIIAKQMAVKFKRLMPERAAEIEKRAAAFDRELVESIVRWKGWMAPYRGTKVVTYHRSWSNFARRFGLDVIDFIEPRPGIPPAPAHLHRLIKELSRVGVKAIIMEPYFDAKLPEKISHETGIPLVVLCPSTGGTVDLKRYADVFEVGLKKMVVAFGGRL